jgi:hypothetical protein
LRAGISAAGGSSLPEVGTAVEGSKVGPQAIAARMRTRVVVINLSDWVDFIYLSLGVHIFAVYYTIL